MKKFIILFLCLGLAACRGIYSYNPNRTDMRGLMQNDAFRQNARPDQHVSNRQTITLISSISPSMGAPYYTFTNFESRPGGHGLGFSRQYEFGGDVRATIFAYHRRMTPAQIPTDIHSAQFAYIYQNEIDTIKSQGHFQNIRQISSGFVTIRGIEQTMEFKRFQFNALQTRSNTNVISAMYLTVHNGAFLKVRITYPNTEQHGPQFQSAFMQRLVTNLMDFNGDWRAFDKAMANP